MFVNQQYDIYIKSFTQLLGRGWDSTWPATAGWRMAKTLKGGMVPGCCCLPADLWLLRGATKHWDKWTGNEKNKLQNICCLFLHNISSFLHNIWQCYNASTSYDNYSTTLICCVIITQHIQNSYTAYQYTTQHIKQSYTTNGFIL